MSDEQSNWTPFSDELNDAIRSAGDSVGDLALAIDVFQRALEEAE